MSTKCNFNCEKFFKSLEQSIMARNMKAIREELETQANVLGCSSVMDTMFKPEAYNFVYQRGLSQYKSAELREYVLNDHVSDALNDLAVFALGNAVFRGLECVQSEEM